MSGKIVWVVRGHLTLSVICFSISTALEFAGVNKNDFVPFNKSSNHNRLMNQRQRSVFGTVTIALIVAAMFYIPWRIESTGDLTWAPFYRNPIMGRSTVITGAIETQFVRLKGRPVWGLYFLQLGLIGSAGAGFYWLARDEGENSQK